MRRWGEEMGQRHLFYKETPLQMAVVTCELPKSLCPDSIFTIPHNVNV